MELQLMTYYTQLNAQTITENNSSNLLNSVKRKLEEDTELRSAKRAQVLSDHSVSIIEEEQEFELPQPSVQPITQRLSDYKPNQFQLSVTATANLGHSASVITLPAEQDTTMMTIDDDTLTDEEESLKTPSNMNYYHSYIPTDLGEDVENGGYTGQLERGWSEMFNEYNV